MTYTREQLGAALKKAHGAGDTASAKKLVGAIRALDAQGSQPSAPPEPVKRVNEFEPDPAPDIAGNNRMIPQPLQRPTQAQAPQTPGISARASEGILRNDVDMRSKIRKQDAFESQVPVNVGEERAAQALNSITVGQFPRAMGAGAGIGAAIAYPLTGGKIGDGQGYGEFVGNETEEARRKARLQVTRGREKRPLESMGIELGSGLVPAKSVIDLLMQGKNVGGFLRGVASGAIGGATYGLFDRSNDVGNIEQHAIGDTGAVSNREVTGGDVAQVTGIGAVAGGVFGGSAGKTIEVVGNRASGRVQGNMFGGGKVDVGNLLDMELAGQPLSPNSLNRVVSIIRKDGNLAAKDIRGLFEAIQQRLKSMDVGQSDRLTIGQALSEALERDYPQAARNIETALLSSRLSTRNNDSSPGIVGRVADDLRDSQSDFLSGSTKTNLGDKSAISLSDELDAARSDLGKQYDTIFDGGTRPESSSPDDTFDNLDRAINYWRNDTGLTKATEMIARGEGYDAGIPFSDALEHYIKTDPRRTAHWMQSAAAQIIRKEKAKPTAEQDDIVIRNYTQIRDNLLKPLQEATPGYSAIRSKFGSAEEIDTASDAGDNFFLKARNEGELDKYIRDEIGTLSPEARAAALGSIRDKIGSFLRGGPEDGPARITQISSTGALDALEKLGPEGVKLADDIRFIRRENQHLGKFVPVGESASAKNFRAMGMGESLGGSGITSAMKPKAEGGGDIAAMIRFSTNIAGKGINALSRPRVRTLEDTTRFLMSRKGNIPSKPKGADFTPRFEKPSSTMPKGPVHGAGLPALRGDAGNALIGGAVGAAAPADSTEERARNAVAMAGAGAVAGRVGRRVSPKGPVRGAGVGGKLPKTAQQAAKFETPGSPQSLQRVIDGEAQPTAEEMRVIANQIRDAEFADLVKAFYGDEKKARAFKYLSRKNYLTKAEEEEFARLREQSNPNHVDTELADLQDAVVLQRAFEDIEGGEYEQVLADAFRRFPMANEPAERIARGQSPYTSEEKLYASIAKRAIAEAKLQGRDPTEVFNNALGLYGNRFSGDDKAFMRKSITDLMGDPDKAASPVLSAGFAGSKPPKRPKPKGRPGIGTRSADAAAIGAISLQGQTADAEGEVVSSELKAANKKVAGFEAQIREIDTETIPAMEEQIRLLQDHKADPEEKQRILIARGHDLGTYGPNGDGVDGVITRGSYSAGAIVSEVAKIEADIAKRRAVRERLSGERDKAQGEVTSIKMKEIDQDAKEATPILDNAGKFGSYVGGLYLAHKFRGGALRKSQRTATATEAKANALLSRKPPVPPVPEETTLGSIPFGLGEPIEKAMFPKQVARNKAATNASIKAAKVAEPRLSGDSIPPISTNTSSPDGLPTRVANLNQYYNDGGAKGKVPFEDLGNGQFAPRTDVMPDHKLYGPAGRMGRFMEPVTSRLRTGDAAVTAAGAADYTVMTGMLETTREDIATTKAELKEVRAKGDDVNSKRLQKDLEKLETIESVYEGLQRLGGALAIGGGLGVAHGRHARPQPRHEAAIRERSLINRAISQAPPGNALAQRPARPLPPRNSQGQFMRASPKKPRTPRKPKSDSDN